MSNHYSPRDFFRRAPNRLLKRYFSERSALAEVDLDHSKETDIESAYTAWLELPEGLRLEMEKDFREIEELANEGGSKAIMEVARHSGEELSPCFAETKSFYERALWTFLERKHYWLTACAFYQSDRVPSSYWRKRKGLPCIAADFSQTSLVDFEQKIGSYFYSSQGRGKNCKVEYYQRDGLDYFFAFPEDYAQSEGG